MIAEFILTYLGKGIGKVKPGDGNCTFPLPLYVGNEGICYWSPKVKMVLSNDVWEWRKYRISKGENR